MARHEAAKVEEEVAPRATEVAIDFIDPDAGAPVQDPGYIDAPIVAAVEYEHDQGAAAAQENDPAVVPAAEYVDQPSA